MKSRYLSLPVLSILLLCLPLTNLAAKPLTTAERLALLETKVATLQASLAESVPFSGAFFVRNNADDPHTAGVMAFHSDRTVTNTNAGMFCVVAPNCGGLKAPDQGTWQKVSDNEILVTLIQFETSDLVGGDFTDNGTIYKFTWIQTFDDLQGGVFQHFAVTDFTASIYSYDQNPITDVPLAVIDISDSPFGGLRVNVE